jgi:hypothetical protein
LHIGHGYENVEKVRKGRQRYGESSSVVYSYGNGATNKNEYKVMDVPKSA